MSTEFITTPLIIYILVTTFSPGPNTLSSAAIALGSGYRKVLPHTLGIAFGFFVLMLLASFFSSYALSALPSLQQILGFVGALYLVTLAVLSLLSKDSLHSEQIDASQHGFRKASPPFFKAFFQGVFLQFLNVKVILYGVLLYSNYFGASIAESPVLRFTTALALSLVSLAATNLYAVFGSFLKSFLHNRWMTWALRLLLFLTLMYVAIDMAGWL